MTSPAPDTAEFIEIQNVGTSAADLSGFSLQLVNGTGGGASVYNTITLPVQPAPLGAGDYFVVCANAATVANCDLDVSPDTNLVQNGAPDAVALFDSGGTLLDTVSYEGDAGAPFTEGSGSGLEDSSSSGNDDMGISRCPDGGDSDQNNTDFDFVAITPGAANDCDVGGAGELVINEIDYDQPGTDAAEFIEIKNIGSGAVDLSGFALELVNGNGTSVYNTIALPAVSLGAGEYFVVCGNAATVFGCDLDASPDSNLVQNGSPDAVALTFGGMIVDTVSYEGDTGAPYTEGSGSGLEDPGSGGAGGPNENKGISRLPDGTDTDQNNVDLATACITPGAANVAVASDCAAPGPPSLVINEVDYDQPGSDFAEFVEIKNVGSGAANLGGVDLVLVNGNGTSPYNTIALPAVNLAAGDYFVVCADAAVTVNCDLDVAPDSNLIQNGSPDAVALFFAGAILDTVSYEGDTGAPFTEGSGTGLEDSGSAGEDFKGISRFADGVDSDQNNVDFVSSCITPGGGNTDRTSGCTATGPIFEIFEIQGAGLASPFDGSTVTTADNVVTCLATDGFFMQTPTTRSDGDLSTSDGIFVFTNAAPTVAPGDLVTVSGQVTEFFGLTRMDGAVSVTVLGNDPGQVPAPVAFDATVPSPDPTAPSCGSFEYECYESMLVEIAEGTVVASNQEFGSDPFAEVHVVARSGRVFREPGLEFPGLVGLPVWDGNPEAFEMDADKLGLAFADIPAGSTFTARGVIGFEFNHYELWPNELAVTEAPLPVPVRPRAAGELTVGSLNLFRLFDDVDDPPSVSSVGANRDDTVVSAAEYQRRRNKFAAYIVDVLDSPDVLAVQEAEKLEVLDDLAGDVNALDPSVTYTAHLIEGNDVGTIDVGFLVRDTVQVGSLTQLAADELFTFDDPPSALHDRPPLLLEASYVCDCDTSFDSLELGLFGGGGGGEAPGPGCEPSASYTFQVMVVHNRSLSGIESGPRVAQKRFEQAQSIAQLVQDLQVAEPGVKLVVTGDFNAYEFSDGFVDAVGHIRGDFVAADSLVSGPDLVDPNLTNQVLNLSPEERYSFIFRDSFNAAGSRGDAQVLDHALTSVGIDPLVTGFAYGRGNADAAEEFVETDATLLRASDHDGLVVYLSTECPRQLKGSGIDLLTAVLPTGDSQLDHQINLILGDITASLASTLWSDALHPDSQQVFEEERQAARRALFILGVLGGFGAPGPVSPEVEAAAVETLAGLVAADRILVEIALTEAIAAAQAAGCLSPGPSPVCIQVSMALGKAESAVLEAEQRIADGRPDLGIQLYKEAWRRSQSVLDFLD